MALDYSKLNVEIADDKIMNANEIVDYLQGVELDQEGCEYLRSLVNGLDGKNYYDVEKIVNEINAKIIKFDADLKQIDSDTAALKAMQSINKDLKKIKIEYINHDYNDSNKNTEYIYITHDDGKVEMLVCEFDNKLNEYIQSHASDITTLSAEDIFKFLKENYYRDLDFEKIKLPGEGEELAEEKINVDNEKANQIKIEKEEMESLKKDFNLPGDVTMAYDEVNDERIYQIDGGLIKFNKVGNNIIRQIIEKPLSLQDEVLDKNIQEQNDKKDITSNEKVNEESNEDLISELNDTQETNFKYEGRDDFNYHITKITGYLDIPDITSLDVYRMSDLLDKKNQYDGTLTSEEEIELQTYVKYLLENMQNISNKLPNEEIAEKYDALLQRYLYERNISTGKSIMDLDGLRQAGIASDIQLSDIEVQFIQHYENNKEYINENRLSNIMNKQKQRIRVRYDQNKSGITTIVMLLEIAILAMFILMFIRIDI